MNYTQQCQRIECTRRFDGAAKSDYCSDKCEVIDLRAENERLRAALSDAISVLKHSDWQQLVIQLKNALKGSQ